MTAITADLANNDDMDIEDATNGWNHDKLRIYITIESGSAFLPVYIRSKKDKR